MSSTPQPQFHPGCPLENVLATDTLAARPARRPNSETESQALITLAQALAKSPQDFFQKLVESALRLSGADSTGISLLDEAQQRFVWPAVAGPLNVYLGGGTPSNFGPCGTVLERNTALLFAHPERYYTYLEPIRPPLEEVLLVPFYLSGRAVGTIWAVIHQAGHQFDAEDKRLLQSLSDFAASAYKTLAETGAIQPLLQRKYPQYPQP